MQRRKGVRLAFGSPDTRPMNARGWCQGRTENARGLCPARLRLAGHTPGKLLMAWRGKPRHAIPSTSPGMATAGETACNHAREMPHDTRKITIKSHLIPLTDIMANTEKPTKYNRHIVS